jgi:hypothetical protein
VDVDDSAPPVAVEAWPVADAVPVDVEEGPTPPVASEA